MASKAKLFAEDFLVKENCHLTFLRQSVLDCCSQGVKASLVLLIFEILSSLKASIYICRSLTLQHRMQPRSLTQVPDSKNSQQSLLSNLGFL